MTGSTRHILAPSHDQDHLGPPSPMYATRAGSPAPSSHSLTVNYLPSKFSNSLVSRRRGKDAKGMQGMMPRGGGVDAFRSNASRMPGKGDEDYDGVDVSSGGRLGGKARWTRFKVILFVANIVLSCYSLCALVFSLLTYFHTLKNARILLVANTSELALSTLAAAFALFVSLIGYPGILLNNRPFLAVYTFLLWIAFGLLVVPGYITYKRRTLNLEAKVNQQWSQELGAAGRLTIQSVLGCCGYFSPFVEATVSATCYSRSILPGCKQQFLEFQEKALTRWYIVSFGLVPVHIAIMAAGLLCSNHVTYRFGKGMMPKAYRLSREAMAVIMEQYASQLADQYGADAAAHMIANNSGNTGPRAQTHTRGTGSGLSGLGSGSGSGSGG
ncbi:hypothetical protein B0H16DRAFT_1328744 [Mycena metata]|uniref:Tetraspanin Tsp2 n=2 Tax=Mycena metata TaxID=1033252 RepID=A0AAD7MTU8_9AGAR|nr:hypothetical protein B0H16DRAFT_1328744 [Mycena metata]